MNPFEQCPDSKQRFQGSQKITPRLYSEYKDRIEKDFIINSLRELPIEKLKELVSFEVINPFDGSMPKSMENEDYRCRLRDKGVIEFRMEILI